jgi:beta-galactosidase
MKPMTRREFLASTAALTAASVLDYPALTQIPAAAAGTQSQRLLSGWEHHRGDLGAIWEVWHGGSAGDHIDWQAVQMPHCVNARDAVDPDQPYYQGPVWYRMQLPIANTFRNGRTVLHFEGAGQKTEIFVANTKVGQHVGGYDEFAVDITEAAVQALKDPEAKGAVRLAIRCDNSRDLEMMPSILSDFNLYGGLYRYVNLIYLPAISLERIHIDPKVQSGLPAEISVKARLYNPSFFKDEVRLTMRILDPGGSAIHTASQTLAPWDGERELWKHQLPDPQLWGPSSPALYHCEVNLASVHGEMRANERFGFRSFEFMAHGPFKLNGQRLLIRGTQRHEDHAGLGCAMTEELIRQEMMLIKDVGANFIRLGHYQQSRIVLDMCDELGIMVWEEIPWCRSGIGGEAFQQQARRMLGNMIDQHYNHPAVILWGLGNENDWEGEYPERNQDKIRALLLELNQLAHRLDPSRKTSIRRCDFCKDIPDVYSPSIWAGWYRGRYTEYRGSAETEMKRVDHFLHMEWGGDSHARRHSEDPDRVISKIATGQGTDERGLDYLLSGGQERASRDGDWSETYICNLFDWHLKEQEAMPWLTGAAQWIFKDFSTPERPENPVPRVNQKGLVERDFTIKEGYYVFQSYWTERPMVHIYGHSWPVRWGEKGEQKLVKVYSNCETAELFLNGVSQGVKKRSSQDFPAAGLRWNVVFPAGGNQLRAVAHKNGAAVTDEIDFHYQTEKWGQPARLELKELLSQGDTATVEVRLLDEHGVQCLDSRALVRFGLQGDGALFDNLGTSRGSRVVQLYNGRAQISLARNAGKSVVSVASKGLPTEFLTVA